MIFGSPAAQFRVFNVKILEATHVQVIQTISLLPSRLK